MKMSMIQLYKHVDENMIKYHLEKSLKLRKIIKNY